MDKDGYHGYDKCKHDWHFVANTETLKCSRCGEITGPRTYEERVQDILEYDTTQFYMPTGQLQVANFKPNYNLTFHRDGQQVGQFDFNGPEMIFEGDAAESAKVFVDFVARSFYGRLKEERDAGREEARQEMQGRVETLDEMYKLASRQRDELMDQQRAQVEAMRGRIQ
jgi:hypothetical protein